MTAILAIISSVLAIIFWWLKNKSGAEAKWWKEYDRLKEEQAKFRDVLKGAVDNSLNHLAHTTHKQLQATTKAIAAHRLIGQQRGFLPK